MSNAERFAEWIIANKDKKGTPDFEKVAAALREVVAAGDTGFAVEPEDDDRTAFGRGLSGGIDTAGRLFGSSLEGAGRVSGLEGLEKYGAEMVAENEAQLAEQERFRTRLKDVTEGDGTVADFALETLGETVPLTGTSIAAAAAAGAAAGSLFPGLGTFAGFTIGALGGALSQLPFFYGGNREAQKEAIEQGLRLEMDEGTAFLTALPQAILDAIAERFAITKLFPTQKAVRAGGLFSRASKGAGAGVVTEIPTELGQTLLERAQAGLELDSEEALDQYVETAVAAGLVGGTVGGGAAAISPRTDVPPTPDPDVPEGTQGDLFEGFVEPEEVVVTEEEIAEVDVPALIGSEKNPDDYTDAEREAAIRVLTFESEVDDVDVFTLLEGDKTEAEYTDAEAEAVRRVAETERSAAYGTDTEASLVDNLFTRNPTPLSRQLGYDESVDPEFVRAAQTRQQEAIAQEEIDREAATTQEASRQEELSRLAEAQDTLTAKEQQDAALVEETTQGFLQQEVGDLFVDETLKLGRGPKDTPEAAPEAEKQVTKKFLNELGVADKAALRARIQGKKVTDTDLRAQLTSYANLPSTTNKVKTNINTFLATPAEAGRYTQTPDTGGQLSFDFPRAKPRRGVGPPSTRAATTPTGAAEEVAVGEIDDEGLTPANLPPLDVQDNKKEARFKPTTRKGALKSYVVYVPNEPATFYSLKRTADRASVTKKGAMVVAVKDLNARQQNALERKAENVRLGKKRKATQKVVDKAKGIDRKKPAELPSIAGVPYEVVANKRNQAASEVVALSNYDPKTLKEINNRLKRRGQTKKWQALTEEQRTQVGIDVSADVIAKRNPELLRLQKLLGIGYDINPVLDLPLEEETIALLREGKLQEALEAVAKTIPDAKLSDAARRLASVVGDTRVIIVPKEPANPVDRLYREKLEDVTQEELDKYGPTVGLYSFDTSVGELNNIILLDEDVTHKNKTYTGLTAATLLHEMTHAATYKKLRDAPNSPQIVQLRNMYNAVKNLYLSKSYGVTNLDEFIAEAFSNPAFQQELATINVEGSNVSLWQKFKNVVWNILQTVKNRSTNNTVPINTVKMSDEVQSIINTLLSPSYNTRNTGVLLEDTTYEGVTTMMRKMGSVQKTFKPIDKKFREGFVDESVEFLNSGVADNAQKFFFKGIPSLAMSDVAGWYNKRLGEIGLKLHVLMEKQRGALTDIDAKSLAAAVQVRKWVKPTWWKPASMQSKRRQEEVQILHDIAEISTIEEVDPRLSRQAAKEKYSSNKFKIWESMRPKWNKLEASGGQKIYDAMLRTNDEAYNRLVATIGKTINSLDASEDTKAKLTGVYKEMLKGRKDPYFALTRSGKYKLAFAAFNPETNSTEDVFLMFETNRGRERFIKEVLSKEGSVVRHVTGKQKGQIKYNIYDTDKSNVKYRSAPSTQFVNDILKAIPKTADSAKLETAVVDLFIEAMPQTAFAKSFQKRQDIAGYDTNFTASFETKLYDLNRKIVRTEFTNEFYEIERELAEVSDQDLRNKTGGGIEARTSLIERAEFARNPPRDGFAQSANRMAFLWTIGFNTSSALVNLSQIPLFVMPYLSGKYGVGESLAALRLASSYITSAGFSRTLRPVASIDGQEQIDKFSLPSIDNYYDVDANGNLKVRKSLNLPAKRVEFLNNIAPLVKKALGRNQIRSSSFADNLGVDQSGKGKNVIDVVTSMSALMFHQVEQYNRQITLVATYQLELERVKQEKPNLSLLQQQELAAENSLLLTQELNGGAVLETAAPVAQTGLGRVAFMYKGFGIQMYYTMFKTARKLLTNIYNPLKTDSSAERAKKKELFQEAMGQLAGVHGTALFFAGVQGIPLYGSVALVYNLLKGDDEDNFEEVTRKTMGEGWYKGTLTALLGVDVSQRVQLTNLLFQANRYSDNPSPEERVGYYLGGPAWSVGKQIIRGGEEVLNGDLQRGIETMTPAAIKNIMKAYRFDEEGGALTRRKNPIMDDITEGQLLAQIVGFAPSEYTKNQEQAQNAKRIGAALTNKKSQLLRKFNLAFFHGDFDEKRQIIKDIEAFNKRVSKKFPRAAIQPTSLERSMKNFQRAAVTSYNGVSINPAVRNNLIEYIDSNTPVILSMEED